ncbi:Uncharacterized protein involved in cysteine biosynthesis [Cognatiyoonia koreensis]|uniref:Uncharacterized protein involved in cysteine biosynthesis n=1 Tax=Cognatiyoonia koreensis TaxID=364200 RepID=A0A1I0N3K8_9RHOB|nr:EI24 domain-containing protein [Cognatiyoonia koreensis]SEV95405.1 Uncharacterized protein involved in cysteine biosynthesis [Cognatiyoonia koreensis]
MILSSFFKAIGQLTDPRFQRVLWLGLGLTIALLILIYAVILGLINGFTADSFSLPLVGEVTWVDDLLGWGSFFLILISSFFLMVPVASAITSLFLEDVAEAVEAKHYPHLPSVPRTGFYDGLRDSVNFLGLLIIGNIIALILIFVLTLPGVIIFYALNGFLLGREYIQVTAMRRLGREGAKKMWRDNIGTVWLAGCLMAVPLTFPIINLFVPILGAATFTHLFHRLSGSLR